MDIFAGVDLQAESVDYSLSRALMEMARRTAAEEREAVSLLRRVGAAPLPVVDLAAYQAARDASR